MSYTWSKRALLAALVLFAASAPTVTALVVPLPAIDGFDGGRVLPERLDAQAFALPASHLQAFESHNAVVRVAVGDGPGSVTVTIGSPTGTSVRFAEWQPQPPTGWVLAHLGTRLQYLSPVGGASGAATFLVRVVGTPSVAFSVDVVKTTYAGLVAGHVEGVVAVTQVAPATPTLQIIPVVRLTATGETFPTATLLRDDYGAFESGLLVAFFDANTREYIMLPSDGLRLTLARSVPPALPGAAAEEIEVTAANGAFAGGAFNALVTPETAILVADRTAVAPPLPSGAAFETVRATMVPLWGRAASDRVATWVAQHPGPLTVRASYGSGVAEFRVTDLVGPGLAGAPVAVTVLPAGGDADFDGFTSVNEIRGGSQAHLPYSTPYTDDDGDSIVNARDLNPLVNENQILRR